jgi:chromosome segregation ATPase
LIIKTSFERGWFFVVENDNNFVCMNKEELEKRKLQLEVKKLEVPWYNNIEFWKVLIPTIAVLLSLYFTFGRGLMDSEKSKLEIQKEQLKLDISRFEMKRDQLEVTILSKDSLKDALEHEIESYNRQKQQLKKKVDSLSTKLQASLLEITNVSNAHNKDRQFYQNELLKEYSKEKTTNKKVSELYSKIDDKDEKIATCEEEIKYLRSKIVLTPREETDLDLLKLNKSIKINEAHRGRLEDNMKRINDEYKREKEKLKNMSDEELVREFELMFIKLELELEDK